MISLSRLRPTSVPVRRIILGSPSPVFHPLSVHNCETLNANVLKRDHFSTTSLNFEQTSHGPTKLLVEEHFKVPSFGGSVFVNAPFDVQVKPTGALDYPNLDQSFFRIVGPTTLSKSNFKVDAKQSGKRLQIDVETDSELNDNHKTKITVEAPIVHCLDIMTTGEASIEVSDFLESEFCRLKTNRGDIVVSKIKTENLAVDTNSGEVMCLGHIQGNIRIHTNSGNVVCDKRFMGRSLDISTVTGDIRVASSYAENSKFSTSKGSMNLRNLHNESYIAVYEQGDVKVMGMDGATNVFIKKGDLDIQVSQVRSESRLHVEEGDIHLRLSDAHPLKVSIEANDVIPDLKFQSYGKLEKLSKKNVVNYFAALHPDQFSPTLVVIAENGNVILDSQDWAASLGLKIMSQQYSAEAANIEMLTTPTNRT